MIFLQIFTMFFLAMALILLLVYVVSKIMEVTIVNDLFIALLSTFTVLLCIITGVLLEIFLYQRWLA